MEENKIYSFLKQNNLTAKSQDEFLSEYADSAKVRQLHKFFTDNSLTSKDFDTFYKDNFTKVTPVETGQTTDYGPFDPETVNKSPQAKQNFDRWQQETNGKLPENANVAPEGNEQTGNIPSEPRKKGFWNTYAGDTAEAFAGGSAMVAEWLPRIQNMPYKIAANIIANREGVKPEEKQAIVEAMMYTNPNTFGAEMIGDDLKKKQDNLQKKSDRYEGKDFVTLWKEGDKGSAVGEIFLQATRSLPISIGAGAAALTGAWIPGLAVIGAGTAAKEYDELTNPELKGLDPRSLQEYNDKLNMGEFAKVSNAILSGVGEAGSEMLGTIPVMKWIKATPGAGKIVTKGLKDTASKFFEKFGLLTEPVTEGLEEWANTIWKNTVDKVTGIREDWNPLEESGKNFVYGFAGGAQGTGFAYGAKKLLGGQQPATPEQQPFTVGEQATPPITEEQFKNMSPKDKAILDVTNEINATLDKNGQVTMIRTGDEKNPVEYFVYDPDASQTGIIMVYDPKNPGKKIGIQVGEIMGKPVTMPVEQVIADKIAELDQREAVSKELEQNVLDIEGKKYVYISEQDGNVVLQEITQDELGNLTPVENQYLIRDKEEFDALLAEKQAELQREQKVEDKVTETVTGAAPETPLAPQKPKYPLDKKGQPDIDNMDEAMLFEYNLETNGEEVALADLNEEIEEAKRKLATSDTKTKVKARARLKELTDVLNNYQQQTPKQDETEVNTPAVEAVGSNVQGAVQETTTSGDVVSEGGQDDGVSVQSELEILKQQQDDVKTTELSKGEQERAVTTDKKTEIESENSDGSKEEIRSVQNDVVKALEDISKLKPNIQIKFENNNGYEQIGNLNDTHEFTVPSDDPRQQGILIKGLSKYNYPGAPREGVIQYNEIAEAYYKAKQDGSNPEFVTTIETILSTLNNNQDENNGNVDGGNGNGTAEMQKGQLQEQQKQYEQNVESEKQAEEVKSGSESGKKENEITEQQKLAVSAAKDFFKKDIPKLANVINGLRNGSIKIKNIGRHIPLGLAEVSQLSKMDAGVLADILEGKVDKKENEVVKEPITLYRGKSKGDNNTGTFYSDSETYANKFAASKGWGEVEKITLPKEAKIFSIGYDNGLRGLVDKIKAVIPELTTEEEAAILDRKYKDVLKNRGYDGISYKEEESEDKEATTYELFEQQTPATDSQEKPSEIKEAVSASENYLQKTINAIEDKVINDILSKPRNVSKTAPEQMTRDEFGNWPRFMQWQLARKSGIKEDVRERDKGTQSVIDKTRTQTKGETTDEAPTTFFAEGRNLHKEIVEKALTEGKQVYEGWQNDYPELAKQFPDVGKAIDAVTTPELKEEQKEELTPAEIKKRERAAKRKAERPTPQEAAERKEIRDKAIAIEPINLEQAILQYIVKGGRLNWAEIKREVFPESKTEINRRIWMLSNDAETIDNLRGILNGLPFEDAANELNVFRNAVLDIVLSYDSRHAMAERVLEIGSENQQQDLNKEEEYWKAKAEEQALNEQAEIDAIWENVVDNSISESELIELYLDYYESGQENIEREVPGDNQGIVDGNRQVGTGSSKGDGIPTTTKEKQTILTPQDKQITALQNELSELETEKSSIKRKSEKNGLFGDTNDMFGGAGYDYTAGAKRIIEIDKRIAVINKLIPELQQKIEDVKKTAEKENKGQQELVIPETPKKQRTVKPVSKETKVEHAGYEGAKRVTRGNENTLEIEGYGTILTSMFINKLVENGRLPQSALKDRNIQLTERYATELLNKNEDLFPADPNINSKPKSPFLDERLEEIKKEKEQSREKLESELAEKRKQKILTEGSGFDKEFGLIPPSQIKTADDIQANVDKIISTLKANEGNKKYDLFEGFAYGGKYAKNAGEQIREYFVFSLDVLPAEIRKAFAEKIGVKTSDDVVAWGEKQYKSLSTPSVKVKEAWEMTREEWVQNNLPEKTSKGYYNPLSHKYDSLDNTMSRLYGDYAKMLDKAFIDGKPVAKPSWAMTKKEYVDWQGEGSEEEHKITIIDAKMAGKPIPANVKAEYPELFEEKPVSEDKIEETPKELYSIQLVSKNNNEKGIYLYKPIIKIGDKYYWGDSIKTSRVIKKSDVDVNTVNIVREIPKEYYEANGIKVSTPEVQSPEKGEAQKPIEKIEDFGEKIEGARKDQIKKYFDKINLNGKILSTIFPKPDIKELLESGLSVKDVAAIKVAHEFATHDKKKGERVMKFYAAYAKNILAESINLEYKNEGIVFTDFGKSQIELRTKAYQDVHDKLGADYLALDLTKVSIKEPDKSGRTTYYSNGEPIAASDVNYIVRYYVNTQKYFATLPEAIDYFTEQVKANTKIDEVVYKRKLNIYYDKRVKGEFYIGFPSKGDVIKLKDGFKTSREAFDALKNPEILADLQTMLERILSENRQKSKPAVRLKYSNETARERVGKDWRNGKNIGAKELAETFGFRAIEFGNWVNQKERQVFVNNTYDSLMDLAQLLNISPRSISLAGNLGLTFGSRGSGKAAAHYEPGRKIINLTKTQGLGSLAHEWWHGIDNYFADFKTAMNGMKSASAQEYSPEAREEVKKAFDELAKAVNNYTFKQRAQNLDGTRSVEYFALPHEMSARAFENYTLNRLAQSGQVNDFIVNYISNEDWNGDANKYPYPIAEESVKIGEAFTNLFDTIEERIEGDNTIMFKILGEKGAQALDKSEEATFRMDNLNIARDMEDAKKDPKSIKQATGWERGADGDWRFETKDFKPKKYVDKAKFAEAVRARAEVTRLNNENDYDTDREEYLETIEKYYESIGYSWYDTENSRIIDKALQENNPELLPAQRVGFNIKYWSDVRIDGQALLTDVIDDPELFKAYPQLKGTSVQFADLDSGASYNSKQDLIKISKKYTGEGTTAGQNFDERTIQSFLAHEIQHAIQEIEGFAKGGNMNQFMDKVQAAEVSLIANELRKAIELKNSDDWVYNSSTLDKIIESGDLPPSTKEWAINIAKAGEADVKEFLNSTPQRMYERLAGEVEARNVQGRMGFNDEYKRNTLLEETEDVSRADQIFIRENYGVSQSIPNSKQEIKDALNELQSKAPGAAPMVITDSFDELVEKYRENGATEKQIEYLEEKGKNSPAFFDPINKIVYVNTDNIITKGFAVGLWVHENGWHNGVRNIVPREAENTLFTKIHDSFQAIASQDPKIQALVARIYKEYARRDKNGNVTNIPELGNEMAAAYAQKIIANEDLSPAEKTLWEKVKEYLSEFFDKYLNFDSGLFTEKQIAQLVKSAVQSNFQKPTRKDYPFLTDYLDAVADWKNTPVKLNNPSEIPDEFFTKPLRPVMLPSLPKSILKAISIDAKPVIIKEKIFKKNKRNHKELSPDDSRYVLQNALYNPDLIGRSQPKKKEYYWVAVKLAEKNATVVIDVYPGKDVVEIVGWRLIDNKGLERLKKQAEREDEQLLILSPETGSAAALSTLPSGLSDNKGTNSDNENQNSFINFMTGLWHGSPHKFGKFSTQYMGTGEGAQAYGWGLYFTDKEGIARQYADADKTVHVFYDGKDITYNNRSWYIKKHLSEDKKILPTTIENAYNEALEYYQITKSPQDKSLVDDLKEMLNNSSLLEVGRQRNLYKVKIHGDKTIEELNFLRWDKPLTEEQKRTLIKAAEENPILFDNALYELKEENSNASVLYDALTADLGSQKEASLFLLRAGIDGIQYPSEYTTKGQHEDSFNYVVFDENAVEIEDAINFAVIGETGAANLDKAEEATTRLDNLKVAKEMETSGKDAKTIKLSSGWERGADGKWRYEVPDGNFTAGVQRMINTQKRNNITETWKPNKVKLTDIIDDAQLFKAYPHLEDIEVDVNIDKNNKNRGSFINGLFVDESIKVEANSFENFRSVLYHEIQHAIQEIEGFARGGNEKAGRAEAMKYYSERLDELDDKVINGNKLTEGELQEYSTIKTEYDKAKSGNFDFEFYRKLAGETESRNVQTRMNYTPEQRRQTLLEETEDVSRKDQIFIYDSLGASLSTPPPTNFLDDKVEAIAGGARRYKSARKDGLTPKQIIQGFRDMVQEKDAPIWRLQTLLEKMGAKIKKVNPFVLKKLAPGRLQQLVDDFRENYIEPFVKIAAKIEHETGIKDWIEPYLIALHAPERNAKIRADKLKEWTNKDFNLDKWIEQENKLRKQTGENALEDWEIQDKVDEMVIAGKYPSEDEITQKTKDLKEQDFSGILPMNTDDNGKVVNKKFEKDPDAFANAMVAGFESVVPKNLVDELKAARKKIAEKITQNEVEAKLITQAEADNYAKMWQYYVPLRGWMEDASKQFVYTQSNTGGGSVVKRAKGRSSMAESPLGYFQKLGYKSTQDKVEQEIKESLLDLVVSNLDPKFKEIFKVKQAYFETTGEQDPETGDDIWKVTSVKPSPEKFDSGEAIKRRYDGHLKRRTFYQAKQHEVTVNLADGTAVVIVFDELNPDLLEVAQSFNRMNVMFKLPGGRADNADALNNIIQWKAPFFNVSIRDLTNFNKAMFTQFNLQFPLTNFPRDFVESNVDSYIVNGKPINPKTQGKAIKAIHQYITGYKDTTGLRNHVEDFYLNGGTTGYTHDKTPEEYQEEIKKEIENLAKRGLRKGKFKRLSEWLTRYNQRFEDGIRFGVYMNEIKLGKSPKEAAFRSRNATVDFNIRGKLSPSLGTMYGFFEVAVNALAKTGDYFSGKGSTLNRAMYDPKIRRRAFKVAAGFMLMGFLDAAFNDWATGGDDDDENDYYNRSRWMRHNYLNVSIPFGGSKLYFSIALPPGWRTFKGLGSALYDYSIGQRGKISLGETALASALNFIDGYSPIPITGVYNFESKEWTPGLLITPLILKPIYEIANNQNYMGAKISKEPFTKAQEEIIADNALAKDNVGVVAKFMSDIMFKAAGGETQYNFKYEGTERKEINGLMDWNASKLEHFVKGYAGGTGTFIGNALTTTVNTFRKAIGQDVEVDFRDAPFVTAVLRKTPEAKWNIIKEYYELSDYLEGKGSLRSQYKKEAEETKDYSKLKELDKNKYLNQYEKIMKLQQKKIDDYSASVDYKTGEGSEKVIAEMEKAIEEINKLKKDMK